MFSQFLANFTWLDACIIIMVVSTSYRAFHQGVLVETLKLAALLCAIVISLHFYARCGNVINRWFAFLGRANYVTCYTALIAFVVFLFHLMKNSIMMVLTKGEISSISKVSALFLGMIRAVLVCSLVLVGCLIFESKPVDRFIRHTFASRFLLELTPKIYAKAYQSMIKPGFVNEPENEKILMLAEKNSRPVFE